MGTLIERVEVEPGYRLKDYAEYNYLAPQVANLEAAARKAVPRLADRTIWIVSSTRRGGGVAEGLPRIVSLMRQLGLSVEWASIHSPDPAFFPLTKRIHNQLHGMGRHGLGRSDRELYDTVSDQLADALANDISSQDILIVHDPQPLGTGARVKKKRGVSAIWRCHIGFDGTTPASVEAWEFLSADTSAYDRSVLTLQDYVPPFLSESATIMPPGIDPLTHKNRELCVPKTSGILVDAALAASMHPALAPPFAAQALRLQVDGSFKPAVLPEDLGLLFRPVDPDLPVGPPEGLWPPAGCFCASKRAQACPDSERSTSAVHRSRALGVRWPRPRRCAGLSRSRRNAGRTMQPMVRPAAPNATSLKYSRNRLVRSNSC